MRYAPQALDKPSPVTENCRPKQNKSAAVAAPASLGRQMARLTSALVLMWALLSAGLMVGAHAADGKAAAPAPHAGAPSSSGGTAAPPGTSAPAKKAPPAGQGSHGDETEGSGSFQASPPGCQYRGNDLELIV